MKTHFPSYQWFIRTLSVLLPYQSILPSHKNRRIVKKIMNLTTDIAPTQKFWLQQSLEELQQI